MKGMAESAASQRDKTAPFTAFAPRVSQLAVHGILDRLAYRRIALLFPHLLYVVSLIGLHVARSFLFVIKGRQRKRYIVTTGDGGASSTTLDSSSSS